MSLLGLRRETLVLALLLGLPPLFVQLRLGVPRLDADAIEYFSHVRSLYFDHDLDFANEFAHFGILTRGDKAHPTITGHRRTIFSVGPALLWMPFYAAGDLWARATGDVEDGYSPAHIRAVCLASLVYGVLGLLLVNAVLLELVPKPIALWTTLTLLYSTFLFWYMVNEVAVSHALSFFASALVLFAYFRTREHLSPQKGLLLGFLIGIAAVVRWQNAVLLLLPAATLLPWLRKEIQKTLVTGCLTCAAFGIGAFPQMLAWKAIFGSYLLKDPPHGRDFLRLDHPYLLQVFFSSRHGLFFWTPVLWGGFLGYILLLRRDRRLGLALLVPLLVMTYVNACSGDWWAGGSFSNRRFDSVLPFLAVGLAATLAFLGEAARRRPGTLLVLSGMSLVLANFLFMEVYRRALIPLDDTVAFPAVAATTSALVTDVVGSPPAWPANWAFASRHSLPVAQYDLMVGKYLFYRQNNLGGVIAMGDPRADPALLDQGWSSPHSCGKDVCRGVLTKARIFAPLDVPEDLDLVVRAKGSGRVSLGVNGVFMAELPLSIGLSDLRVRVPRESFHRELNEIAFSTPSGSAAWVSRLVFLKKAPR
jgi:hypothetical protein